MTEVEGKIVTDATEALPVAPPESSHQVEIFNPLDAQPVAFKRQLTERSENYDNLAMHLRGMLVPGKDFGRIHVMPKSKCPEPWHCSYEQNPGHYSQHQLFAAGADKVLGMLGLGVHYPNEQDFVRAALKGMQILDVIMKCHILGHGEQTIAEGMGACGRDEVNGSLNNAIKRACKRARVDAVLRLPSISALFEDDFLASVERHAGTQNGNSTTSRQQGHRGQNFNTGAHLKVMPIGKKMKGLRFDEMEDFQIDWILRKLQDKPDIWNAAKRVYDRRHPAPPVENQGKTGDAGPHPDVGESSDTTDWLNEYDDYEAMHGRKS